MNDWTDDRQESWYTVTETRNGAGQAIQFTTLPDGRLLKDVIQENEWFRKKLTKKRISVDDVLSARMAWSRVRRAEERVEWAEERAEEWERLAHGHEERALDLEKDLARLEEIMAEQKAETKARLDNAIEAHCRQEEKRLAEIQALEEKIAELEGKVRSLTEPVREENDFLASILED